MNISYAADLWLGTLTAKGHSDRTVDKYRRLLYKLADEHPRHIDIEDISIVDLRGFLERQSRRRNRTRKAPATIAQDVSTLCQFFDWLTREGVVKRNPTRRNGDRIIDRPKLVAADENDNVKTISGDGVRALLEHANRGDWSERLAVNVLVYSGARRHAVAQIRIGDYDPVSRMLTFFEKNAKTIAKPVPHELARVIEAAVAAGVYETADDYLIPARAKQRRDGDRDDRIIWRIVRDVAARAGVDTHVHALRAAFAVHYLETHPGHSVALQKLMGHKRPETTQVYLRRLDRRQAMETVRDLSWELTERGAITFPVGLELHGQSCFGDSRDTSNPPRSVSSASPQTAEELFESLPLTEKEGFEPSLQANPHSKRVGTENADPAPVIDLMQRLRARALERGTHD